MLRSIGWWLCLAGGATLVALIVSPQLVFITDLLLEPWAPDLLLQLGRHLTFELGLWGFGIAAWRAGLRLGWAASRSGAIALVAAPALSESLLLFGLERVSGQLTTPLGLACRIGVGLAAIALVVWPRRSV